MLLLYSDPHPDLLAESNKTLHVCKRIGYHGTIVIDAKAIQTLVAMLPFPLTVEEARNPDTCAKFANCFYVREKLALDTAQLAPDELEDDKDEVD